MKTKKELEQEYIRSYNKHEVVFIIFFLLVAVCMIVIGFILPI
jgi:hypothetical protein